MLRYMALGVLAVACWGVLAQAEIEVGVAKRVITPDPLLPLSGGAGPTSPCHSKQGELTTRALVLRHNGTTVAIVSVDALGFPSVLGDRARKPVPRIPAENILIGATHTHSAPDCYAFPDGKGGHTGDLAYMDHVANQAAEAINEALDHLQPASLKIATGEVKGRVAYNYYAPQLYDRRAHVIQAVAPGGQVVATLVNYAIHPEVLGPDRGILSPDLVGPLCDRIEASVGGMTLFMNSAEGGMVTADNRELDRISDAVNARWHDARTWEECLRIGQALADESMAIVKNAPLEKDPALYCGAMTVQFPVESPMLWGYVEQSPLGFPHGTEHVVSTRLNLINLGDAQILTIPGETLPNIGFYLKRKMHGRHNLLFGLTNDAFGYILTKVDFQSFPTYDYISRTSLGEMTGEILIEKSLELVEKSPRPEK